MNPAVDNNIEPYTLLRAALTLFQKAPPELETTQLQQVQKQARNEYEIEERVLHSQEAGSVIISEEELQRAYQEIYSRFNDEDHFLTALEANRLNPLTLRAALYRQCKVNAVMEWVASRAPQVNEVEIGIFYHTHPEKFHRPEQRHARHILMSINPDFPENTRETALQRMVSVADSLKKHPHRFADMALKYSECPTALNGGDLGTVVAGKLYPELDAALFALKEKAISAVVETEIGFHLIQCLKIIPPETLSLKKATPKIRELMQERYRRRCQRAWLAQLPASKGE